MRRLTCGLLLLIVLVFGAPAQAHALTDTQLERCRSLNAALDTRRDIRGMRVLCQVGADRAIAMGRAGSLWHDLGPVKRALSSAGVCWVNVGEVLAWNNHSGSGTAIHGPVGRISAALVAADGHPLRPRWRAAGRNRMAGTGRSTTSSTPARRSPAGLARVTPLSGPRRAGRSPCPGGSGPRIRTWYGGGGNRSRSIATRNESPTAGLLTAHREPEREGSVDQVASVGSNRISSRRLGQEIVPSGVSQATTDRPKSTVGGSVSRRSAVQAASSPAWSPIRCTWFRSPTPRWRPRSCHPSPLGSCRE